MCGLGFWVCRTRSSGEERFATFPASTEEWGDLRCFIRGMLSSVVHLYPPFYELKEYKEGDSKYGIIIVKRSEGLVSEVVP